MAEYENLPRRQVRYWCFRFKTEADGGVSAQGAPRGLKQRLEKEDAFEGWKNFAVTWDVDEDEPLVAIPRNFSVWEEWGRTLERVVKPLPGRE
jgi:hypothetical protein